MIATKTYKENWPDEGIYTDVPTDAYLALGNDTQRGERGFVMSSTALKEFISQGPRKWKRSVPREGNWATGFGSLVDAMLFSPKEVEARFAVRPSTYVTEVTRGRGDAKKTEKVEKPWNANSNTCKAWLEEATARGTIVIDRDDMMSAKLALDNLLADPAVSQLVNHSDHQVALVTDYKDPATGITVKVKGLVDIVPHKDSEYGNALADLKTTRDGRKGSFSKTVAGFGYHLQAGLYLELWNALTGEDRNRFLYPVVESEAPFEVYRRGLDPIAIEFARNQFAIALEKYCQCLDKDRWPGIDDDSGEVWSTIDLPKWAYYEE